MEKNKGHWESRTITTCLVAPEDVGFPLVAQAAMITRQRVGRKTETVALVTSLPPEKLDASQWLAANRQSWGIESGLHQRMDVSQNDDRCRVRNPNALWIFGMFRRLANSLFMEWRVYQHNGHYKTTTDFHSAMGEENFTPAIRFITNKHARL